MESNGFRLRRPFRKDPMRKGPLFRTVRKGTHLGILGDVKQAYRQILSLRHWLLCIEEDYLVDISTRDTVPPTS
jgi:hypothetical protein